MPSVATFLPVRRLPRLLRLAPLAVHDPRASYQRLRLQYKQGVMFMRGQLIETCRRTA
jgi:hypothetical protein